MIKKCRDLQNISVSNFSRPFRHRLSLSYKKLGINNPKKMDLDSRSLLTSWCRATIGLLNSGFHLIFVDEFVINRNTIHTYGWVHKGKPGRLLLRPNNFKMSFVVAHSKWRMKGILGTKNTFNQYKFIKFFRHLLTKNLKRRNYWS